MVTRDELYELVWSEPMTKIATRFDVSGSYLARICTLLNVPRPERGYWAKLAVGKAPLQMPLPAPQPGDPMYWTKDGERVPVPRPMAPERRKPDVKVRVSTKKIHGLIRGARSHFEHSRPVEAGAYLRPWKQILVDVTSSDESLDRALNLANDLFNALESVGHRVVMAPVDMQLRRAALDEREVVGKPRQHGCYPALWSPRRPTVVFIGTVAIGLAVIEMSENVLMRYVGGGYIRESEYFPDGRHRNVGHTWTTTQDVTSGRFRIIAYSPYGRVSWSAQWQQTRNSSLTSVLQGIVATIEEAARDLVVKLEEADRRVEVAHREWLEQQERRKRDEDRVQIQRSIVESGSDLRKAIQQWSEVTEIGRFLDGVEQSASSLSDDERQAVVDRLSLARNFLGTQDALDFFMAWKTPAERYQPRYPVTSATNDCVAA